MQVLPLYRPTRSADAWHRVTAPGGYEAWYFDAQDEAGDLRFMACLEEGDVFHPEYLRRYERYRRSPTRHRPPLPGEYPRAWCAVYEKGRALGATLTHVAPEEFSASDERPDVRVGGFAFRLEEDSSLSLNVRRASGPEQIERPARRSTRQSPPQPHAQQLQCELTFRPLLTSPPLQRTILSREWSGAEHQWVIANPLCEVEGMLHVDDGSSPRSITFRGRGYHDHYYGTGPIGHGLSRLMRGRVQGDGWVSTFHAARPTEPKRMDEVYIVEGDASGLRLADIAAASIDWNERTDFGLRYPSSLALGESLRLDRPQVLDATARSARLLYDASCRGRTGRACCEVIETQRVRRPLLERIIDTLIPLPNGRA